MSVRASECAYARPWHFFSETVNYFLLKLYSWLGLVRSIKIFQALFLIIFTVWPKNVFRIFSKTMHQNILIFCSKYSLWSPKNSVFTFWWNLKNGPFGQNWPKFGLNLAKMTKNWGLWFWQFLCEKKGWKFDRPRKTACFTFLQIGWSELSDFWN